MNCDRCNGPTLVERVSRYHYESCGLNNVYLLNIDVRSCPTCETKMPRIPRIIDLFARIGRVVALQNAPLRGADVRFLRKQLGLSASEWAKRCKIDAATLSRCEHDEQRLGPQSDLLMRYVYIRTLEEESAYRVPDAIVQKLAGLEKSAVAEEIEIDVQHDEAYLRPSDISSRSHADFAGRVFMKPPRIESLPPLEGTLEERIGRLPYSQSAGFAILQDKTKYAAITLAA